MQFWRRGVSQAIFLPACADITAPTQAEITAGTPLKNCVSNISGWTTDQGNIPTPTLGSRTTPNLPGEKTFGNPTMTFLEDDGTTGGNSADLAAAYTALADDVAGFMLLAPGATTSSKKCEVWPIRVSSNNRDWTIDGSTPANYVVTFNVTAEPEKNATIAA